MNLNMTLIGQLVAFAVFVWFCMKFVWPPIINALDERTKKIADGLAAAERGEKAQEEAEAKVAQVISEAREHAREILANAEKRGSELVEESKDRAKTEGARIVESANAEIEQEANRAREALRNQVAALSAAGAGRIVGREIDEQAHNDLIEDLVAQL